MTFDEAKAILEARLLDALNSRNNDTAGSLGEILASCPPEHLCECEIGTSLEYEAWYGLVIRAAQSDDIGLGDLLNTYKEFVRDCYYSVAPFFPSIFRV